MLNNREKTAAGDCPSVVTRKLNTTTNSQRRNRSFNADARARLNAEQLEKESGANLWIFGGVSLLAGFPLVVLVSRAGGSGAEAGTVAFLAPLVCFVVALALKSGPQVAIEKGDFGEYKKCPFCAESVRKETIKCKHCGSELTQPSRV